MALTKLSTDVIDLSGNTEALTIPKGTTNSTLDVEYLVVAGGGGGGWLGGGGGAGGYLTNYAGTAMSINAGTSYTVTVGTGGAGATGSASSSSPGAAGPGGSGNNSVFNTVTATGGGGGGSHFNINATTGGSGGGGGSFGGSGASTSDAAQGNDGGANSASSPAYGGGGGGGSAAVGASGSGSVGGNGGAGTQNNIDGNNYFYAAGGGGGVQETNTAGTGGSSIGGDGANSQGSTGQQGYAAPVSNRGSGGGGGGYDGASTNYKYGNGGVGSSGIVTLSYPTTNTLTVGSGIYGDYSTGTTGQCSWPTTSNGVSLFQLDNNLTDTCGNSTAAWVGASAYSTTAKFGSYSAEFSGGDGGTYIDTGVDPDASSNWTVSMWMYRTDTSAFDWLFGSLDGDLKNGFAMSFYNQASQGKFDVYLRDGSGGNVWRTQGSGTRFNNWEYVALTYNNSGSGTTTIYHNGKPITATLGSNPATGSFASATNWCLGSGGTWNIERFNGYIDQARFYDTDLTATEIELLYNETANATTGTIGSNTWSSFIGGTGTISFTASSGSGRPASPTEGLMRENTTTGKMEFYNGTIWEEINDTASSYSPSLIPSANFNTVLYTGTGSGLSENGVGFAPDFVWLKNRDSASTNHHLFDSVRGVGKTLYSDGNFAEATNPIDGYLSAFDSNGFTLSAGTRNANDVSNSGDKYVAWSWKGGGTAVSNPDGTTTSTISKNAAAGFSIVKTSAAGGTINVGHGLGSDIGMIILKGVDVAEAWQVWHKDVGTGKYLQLSSDSAPTTRADSFSTVSSTIFENDWTSGAVVWIAYCFANINGFQKIGFYVGNGSTTGPIIYTGFKPAWLMVKRTDDDANWRIVDNKRNTTNPRNTVLYPNLTNAEYTNAVENVDFLTTGFQLGNTDASWNALRGTYIYMTFSE